MKMSQPKLMIVWTVLLCAAIGSWLAVADRRSGDTLTYSQFLQEVRAGRVAGVTIQGSHSGAVHARCSMKDGKTVRTILPSDYEDALKTLQEKLVNIEIRDALAEPLQVLRNATPFLLLLSAWIFLVIWKFPGGSLRT